MTEIHCRISAALSGPTGIPATVAEPDVGEISVPRIRTVVVLPAPLGLSFRLAGPGSEQRAGAPGSPAIPVYRAANPELLGPVNTDLHHELGETLSRREWRSGYMNFLSGNDLSPGS
jgi:hypothetical protein